MANYGQAVGTTAKKIFSCTTPTNFIVDVLAANTTDLLIGEKIAAFTSQGDGLADNCFVCVGTKERILKFRNFTGDLYAVAVSGTCYLVIKTLMTDADIIM